MKTWKKYMFIYIPIGIFCCIINLCVKKDNKTPYAKFYLLHEFEKDEYCVNDFVSGSNLGKIIFYEKDGILFFDIEGKETSGKLIIGEYSDSYNYDGIKLQHIAIKKKKHKNLEFYAGKVGDWYSVVIMELDNQEHYNYYKSNNRRRYLFYLYKNIKYNFSINDDSVYDLYVSFSGTDEYYSKYAAILE